jgi:hypothetical protein
LVVPFYFKKVRLNYLSFLLNKMGYDHHSHSKSRVNVVHNVAKGPAVDVVVDGDKVLQDVEYKVQSGYLALPSGKHTVSIEAGGNKLAIADVELEPGKDYTVVAHGDVTDLSSISLLPLQDDNSCPAKGKAHLRFVHAAAGAPPVDIWAGTQTRIFENVPYGKTGSPVYLPVDAGKVDVSVTPTGTVDRVVGPLPLTLEQGKVYTVVASGVVGDSEAPLTALVNEDKKCSVHVHMGRKHHHGHHGHRKYKKYHGDYYGMDYDMDYGDYYGRDYGDYYDKKYRKGHDSDYKKKWARDTTRMFGLWYEM